MYLSFQWPDSGALLSPGVIDGETEENPSFSTGVPLTATHATSCSRAPSSLSYCFMSSFWTKMPQTWEHNPNSMLLHAKPFTSPSPHPSLTLHSSESWICAIGAPLPKPTAELITLRHFLLTLLLLGLLYLPCDNQPSQCCTRISDLLQEAHPDAPLYLNLTFLFSQVICSHI